MGYSKLVSYVRLSPNCTKPRDHAIDTITIHHVAADATVEALGALFANPGRQASSNYGIGSDGRIACFVEEENRSWCSGNRENDMRAITIEVANCSGEPDWKISEAAYKSLIALCADICQRHGFTLNFTGDTTGNLTMHKWFQATGCPGPYLESKFPQIAEEVNTILKGEEEPQPADVFYLVQVVGAFNDKANAEALAARLKADGYGEPFVLTVARVSAVDVSGKGIYSADSISPACKAIEEGSTVRVNQGAAAYDGTELAPFVYERDHVVDSIAGDRVVITYGGTVVAAVKLSDLTLV